MKATVIKRFETATAHRLKDHKGKCRHLHGHNFRFEVHVSGPVHADGIVIDFAELKAIVGRYIDGILDHATVLQEGDPLIDALLSADCRVCVVPFPPTAENLAGHLKEQVQSLLNSEGHLDLSVTQVLVGETSSGEACA